VNVAEPETTPATGQVLLSCDGVTLERNRREIVTDVSLDLRAGELIALLGPNGAGKSTLLDGLSGALTPTHGTVELHGRMTLGLQFPALAQRTVLTNMTMALGWWGVPRAKRRQRALEALRQLGAEHLAGRRATELSGGERRRVHLARSVAVEPDVLLLDEPFAGLDGEARSSLLEEAGSALRSERRATLVVVHDREEAWALADRLLVLLDGRLVADGPPRALLERPPSPAVARFLGYDGELRSGDDLLLTRPPQVILDDGGPLAAEVTRAVPTQDGVRLQLELDGGRLHTLVAHPGPRRGDLVRVRIDGGVKFTNEEPRWPASDDASAQESTSGLSPTQGSLWSQWQPQ
jgi:ABC-type multidrug transport system ATPase subunit